MPSLGTGLPDLILDPPAGPVITVAPPAAAPSLLVVPVKGPPGPPIDFDVDVHNRPIIDGGNPYDSTGA